MQKNNFCSLSLTNQLRLKGKIYFFESVSKKLKESCFWDIYIFER